MSTLRKTGDPDLMTLFIEETRRRHREGLEWEGLGSPHPPRADSRAAPMRARKPTFVSQFIYLVMFSAVVILSTLLGVAAGLCAVVMIFAFILAPISAPFFLVGALISGAAVYSLISVRGLAQKTARYGQRAQIIPAAREPRR